jgi:hypothetical protein
VSWAEWANAAASGAVAVCALVFVVTYAALAPWRASEAGRHIMVVLSLAGLLVQRTVMVIRAQRRR